jgi:hypothetical protein
MRRGAQARSCIETKHLALEVNRLASLFCSKQAHLPNLSKCGTAFREPGLGFGISASAKATADKRLAHRSSVKQRTSEGGDSELGME